MGPHQTSSFVSARRQDSVQYLRSVDILLTDCLPCAVPARPTLVLQPSGLSARDFRSPPTRPTSPVLPLPLLHPSPAKSTRQTRLDSAHTTTSHTQWPEDRRPSASRSRLSTSK